MKAFFMSIILVLLIGINEVRSDTSTPSNFGQPISPDTTAGIVFGTISGVALVVIVIICIKYKCFKSEMNKTFAEGNPPPYDERDSSYKKTVPLDQPPAYDQLQLHDQPPTYDQSSSLSRTLPNNPPSALSQSAVYFIV